MNITARIQKIEQDILQAECSSGTSNSVLLMAVSKHISTEAIREAFAAGIQHFGENYMQEAVAKQTQLSDLSICWHFIGSIQRNKTKAIANHFDWVHTVSSLEVAERLNQARCIESSPLNVCIQLNIDNESTKAGIAPVELLSLATKILSLPRLRLRGVMVIPAPQPTLQLQIASFMRVKEWFDEVNAQLDNQPMDTLSMGMSDDFVAAIAAGSNLVRIGTRIFGERK